jgi:hypothetical protein
LPITMKTVPVFNNALALESARRNVNGGTIMPIKTIMIQKIEAISLLNIPITEFRAAMLL